MTATPLRRRTVLAGAGLSALAVASGCGGEQAGSGREIELWLPGPQGTVGIQHELEFYQNLLEPFMEEHGIQVALSLTPWESYEEKYLTGVSSGTGPDVGYMYTEMMGDYVQAEAIVPVDEYLSPSARERMLYLDEGTFDGHQYGVPYVVGNARGIWANTALLDRAGIDDLPATWEEFTDAAAKVQRDLDVAGVVMAWGNQARGMMNESFFPFLWQAGGEIFTEDGSSTAFNSPAGAEAAIFLRELLDVGAMPGYSSGLDGDDTEAMFLEGRAAFAPGATGQLGLCGEELAEFEFIDSLARETRATFVANDALILTEKCPDKELGTALIEFLTAGDNMERFHTEVRASPPIATDEEPDPDDPFKDTYAETDMLRGLPIMPQGNATYNALYENLQQLVMGRKTPEQALSHAAAAGDAALAAGA